MIDRRLRRVVAVGAVVLGVVDLILAAGDRTRVRAGFLGADWALNAVVGARYVLLMAGLGLILVARGLTHGKANAWKIALAAGIVSTLGNHVKQADAIGLVASVAFVGVVAFTRSRFPARSDPALARRGIEVMGIGLAAVFAYGTVGLYLLDRNFRASTTFGESVEDGFRLLVLLPTATVDPITRHGRWFIDSVRFAALAVLLIGLGRVVASVVLRRDRSDEATVRQLLDRWATSSLAYFHLLDDKNWLISSGRDAFIGYKVVGTTAIALGDPIGAPGSVPLVIREFVELCEFNGWTPAFHQVTVVAAADLAAEDLKLLKIGEEAVIDVQRWSIDSSEYKQLRSAVRRVQRADLEFVELAQPIEPAVMAQLRVVSDAWLEESGHRERTFTVGRFDPDYLQKTTVVAVRHSTTGEIVAFANILPSYQSNEGNFDLMRRRPDAPNGVMEFLFVGLIERFRTEGKTGMTLGLAPFANITGDTLADKALRVLYERGDKAFHYQGLHRFKEKWHPRWDDRFVAYRSDADLPKIAAAVMRAGELPAPRSLYGRVRALLRTFPVSLSIGGIIIWLMAVTAIDNDSYSGLLRHFGLGWHDLTRLQLWRLPTSQLIEDRPGFVWANVALCLLALPIAERFITSRRTIVIFFLGDWISTVPVLISARVAAALGNTSAIELIRHRDSGPSSGAWALVVAIAFAIAHRPTRRVALGLVFSFLVGALAVNHRLFDVQHLVSAVAVLLFSVISRLQAGVGAMAGDARQSAHAAGP